jgi:hypothetical protein
MAVRLLDEDSDRAVKSLALYLTPKEAQKARKALDELLASHESGKVEHVHIDDSEYEHHLTLVLYTPEQADRFQERWRRLIVEDR